MIVVLYALGALYLLWLGFVLTMRVAHLWKTLPWPARVLGLPAALFSWVLDVFLNLTLCTVVFVDLPREPTITQRLHRYQRERTDWRARLARWVCANLLNPFDPEHC